MSSAAMAERAGRPAVSVEPASQQVVVSQDEIEVDIVVADVDDLAAFEFQLQYNPAVLTLSRATAGPFLGSTGRNVSCPAPVPNQELDSDRVRFGCVTTGGQDAPDGSGTLATIVFSPREEGLSNLVFRKVELATPLSDNSGLEDLEILDGVVRVVGDQDSAGTGLPPTPTPDVSARTPVPGAAVGTPPAAASGSGGESVSGAAAARDDHPADTPGGGPVDSSGPALFAGESGFPVAGAGGKLERTASGLPLLIASLLGGLGASIVGTVAVARASRMVWGSQ